MEGQNMNEYVKISVEKYDHLKERNEALKTMEALGEVTIYYFDTNYILYRKSDSLAENFVKSIEYRNERILKLEKDLEDEKAKNKKGKRETIIIITMCIAFVLAVAKAIIDSL